MLETELKCMLDADTYEKLEKMFEWDDTAEQVNSYYSDPNGALKRSGITLRVRTKKGVSKIQVKVHRNSDSPLQICDEAEFKTDTVPDGFTRDEVRKMTGLDTDASLLGSLTTLRSSLIYCPGVEICLDKNDYLDRTDYELEIEYTESIPAELIQRLNAAGVFFTAPSIGKCTRFMRRLSEIIHGK